MDRNPHQGISCAIGLARMSDFEYDSTPVMKTTEVPNGQSQEARKKKGTETKVEAPEGKEEAGGQGFKSR
jgi:hypothetical protein